MLRKEFLIYFLLILFGLICFGGWSITSKVIVGAPIMSVVGIGETGFSNLTSWAPIATQIAIGNLLPGQMSMPEDVPALEFRLPLATFRSWKMRLKCHLG